ncbi:hypothetical protein [Lentzea flava]|uniref:Uncharacterized protein n=1 Tax=Lentzea flava TaxID=103732 RepID=A0ABQ2V3W4_9PSEU|nr:hypothetical protein [Lentzea flava]MCP2203457.1 hypothetical protein [Lentzea flava]GGU67807.1 hypothetical protein GCM10010178_69430 [Lentzea flava]
MKAGTKACLATAGRRIGRLEVAQIGGPGRMKSDVTVWDLAAG